MTHVGVRVYRGLIYQSEIDSQCLPCLRNESSFCTIWRKMDRTNNNQIFVNKQIITIVNVLTQPTVRSTEEMQWKCMHNLFIPSVRLVCQIHYSCFLSNITYKLVWLRKNIIVKYMKKANSECTHEHAYPVFL